METPPDHASLALPAPSDLVLSYPNLPLDFDVQLVQLIEWERTGQLPIAASVILGRVLRACQTATIDEKLYASRFGGAHLRG